MNRTSADGRKGTWERLESLFWRAVAGEPVPALRDPGAEGIPDRPEALFSWLNALDPSDFETAEPSGGDNAFAEINGFCLIPLQGDGLPISEVPAFKSALTKARGIVFLIRPISANGQPPDTIDTFLKALTPWLAHLSKPIPFALQIPVTGETEPAHLSDCLRQWVEKGLRLILWLDKGGCLPRQLMWQGAKQGIWNHVYGNTLFSEKCFSDECSAPDAFDLEEVIGQASWIVNNPNIVHSFEDFTDGETIRRDPPEPILKYRRVAPLPGKPFPMYIPDPLLLLPLLSNMTPKELIRYRVMSGSSDIRVLGTGVEFHFTPPDELPRGVMEEIVAMVDAGGSVDITHVRANLERAYLIGYATENGCIVGNSSLKRPRQVFVDRIRHITGLDFTRFVERGYTSVRPEYRAMGIGAKLLEGLTARAVDVKVFSIISEDNLATQKIAIRNNTRKIATYFSEKVGKEMGVWMPEHMIEDEWTTLP